jgi:hypothetical protein
MKTFKTINKRLIALLSTIVLTITATLAINISAVEPLPPYPVQGYFNLRVHLETEYDTPEKASELFAEITDITVKDRDVENVKAVPEISELNPTGGISIYFNNTVTTEEQANSLLESIISQYYNSDTDYDGISTGEDNPIPVKYYPVEPMRDGASNDIDPDEYSWYADVTSYDIGRFGDYLKKTEYENMAFEYHNIPTIAPYPCATYDIQFQVNSWEEAFAVEEKVKASDACRRSLLSYVVEYDASGTIKKYVRYLPDNYKKSLPDSYYTITAYFSGGYDNGQYLYIKNDFEYYFKDISENLIAVNDLGLRTVWDKGEGGIVFDPELVSLAQAETFLRMAIKVYYGSYPNADVVKYEFDEERDENGCFTATIEGYDLGLLDLLEENKAKFHVDETYLADIEPADGLHTANVYEFVLENPHDLGIINSIKAEIESNPYCFKTYLKFNYTTEGTGIKKVRHYPTIGDGYNLDFLDFDIENAKSWEVAGHNDYMPDEWFWARKSEATQYETRFFVTCNRGLTQEEMAQINPLTWVCDEMANPRYTFTFETIPQTYNAIQLINSWGISDKKLTLLGGIRTDDLITPSQEEIESYLTKEEIGNIDKSIDFERPAVTIYGDLNDDNKVQMADIVVLCQAISAVDMTTVLTPQQIVNADVFEDGILNSADLSVLASAMVNSKLSTLPINLYDDITVDLTDEQKTQLEELRKKGLETFGKYPRQEKVILGEIPADLPRLDIDTVMEVISESDSYEEIAEKLAEIQEYPDFVGGSGVTNTEYWFDEKGLDKILLCLEGRVIYHLYAENAENAENGAIDTIGILYEE